MIGLERKRTPSADAAKAARRDQNRLCKALLKQPESDGVIGRHAGESIQRLPSSIYWAGLAAWGLRSFSGSEEQYYRSLDGFRRRRAAQITAEDGEPILADAASNWHPQLPQPPSGFPDQATLRLRVEDAEYLVDRILARQRTSLLGEFVLRRVAPGDHEFPWQEPIVDDLPAMLRETLLHAEQFSLGMHGAALLYNLILAEKRVNIEWAADYRERLGNWWGELSQAGGVFSAWDVGALWRLLARSGIRTSPRTQQFVEAWLQLSRTNASIAKLVESRDARLLIEARERQLKGARARVDNPSALEQWRGAAGIQRLDFRWGRPARRMITELLAPLVQGADDA